MTLEKRRLRRAKLIERVRTVEQRQTAMAASQAEAQRVKLDSMSEKTRNLADHYGSYRNATSAQDLHRSSAMSLHLRQLSAMAEGQAKEARERSKSSLEQLAASERRRQRAADDRQAALKDVLARIAKQ